MAARPSCCLRRPPAPSASVVAAASSPVLRISPAVPRLHPWVALDRHRGSDSACGSRTRHPTTIAAIHLRDRDRRGSRAIEEIEEGVDAASSLYLLVVTQERGEYPSTCGSRPACHPPCTSTRGTSTSPSGRSRGSLCSGRYARLTEEQIEASSQPVMLDGHLYLK